NELLSPGLSRPGLQETPVSFKPRSITFFCRSIDAPVPPSFLTLLDVDFDARLLRGNRHLGTACLSCEGRPGQSCRAVSIAKQETPGRGGGGSSKSDRGKMGNWGATGSPPRRSNRPMHCHLPAHRDDFSFIASLLKPKR